MVNNVNLDVNTSSHVLFLHLSDNLKHILVCELFNGESYGHWRKAMKIALISKNILEFVLRTCTKPDPPSPMASLANQWHRGDKMVISWLTNAIITGPC